MHRVIRAAAIGATILALAGCGTGIDPSGEPSASARVMKVDDPLWNASLADLAKASDVVLVGTLISREEGVRLGTGPGAFPYTAFDIKPKMVIEGETGPSVRVYMITRDASGRPVEIEGRPNPTDGDAIWLLTEIAPEFNSPGEYVLTSVAGVLPAAGGRIAADLSEAPAAREAMGLGTVDKVAEILSPGS